MPRTAARYGLLALKTDEIVWRTHERRGASGPLLDQRWARRRSRRARVEHVRWRDRCANAARVGFRGLGLWHADIEHQLESGTHAGGDEVDLRRRRPAYLAGRVPGRLLRARRRPSATQSDATRQLLFDTAAAFGAHHIKVGNIPGTPCELDRLTEEFAALCDEAAQPHRSHRRLRVHAVRRQRQHARNRAEAGADAGRPNGGLAIDTWHMAKLGITPDDLQRVPLEYSSWVELSDGQFADMDDRVDETVNHRRLPGEGEFDIPGYVRACRSRVRPALGSRGPVGRAA